jgi:hypothetical protein
MGVQVQEKVISLVLKRIQTNRWFHNRQKKSLTYKCRDRSKMSAQLSSGQILQAQLQRKRDTSKDYGMTYEEACSDSDRERERAAVAGAMARAQAEADKVLDVDSDASTEECGWDTDLQAGVGKGECETYYIAQDKSQRVLIAMAQGLVRDEGDPYPSLYVFDLEEDDLVKSCAQKMLPGRKHLIEEANRRAKVLRIKPLKKSAGKNEVCAWLKLHAVNDQKDIDFIRFECKSLYLLMKEQAEEQDGVEKEKLGNRNWSTPDPWMRLYHCAVEDDCRVLAKMEGKGKKKDEVDARNSEARPLTYYEKVAEFYNSDEVYATYALPDLHVSFTDIKMLDIDDMPGGFITADEVKSRLGDARAKLISVSKICLRVY